MRRRFIPRAEKLSNTLIWGGRTVPEKGLEIFAQGCDFVANFIDLAGGREFAAFAASVVFNEEARERSGDVTENCEGIDGQKETKDAPFDAARPVLRAHRSDEHGRPPKRGTEILKAVFALESIHSGTASQNYQNSERHGIAEAASAQNLAECFHAAVDAANHAEQTDAANCAHGTQGTDGAKDSKNPEGRNGESNESEPILFEITRLVRRDAEFEDEIEDEDDPDGVGDWLEACAPRGSKLEHE